jgi:hypothetical protein
MTNYNQLLCKPFRPMGPNPNKESTLVVSGLIGFGLWLTIDPSIVIRIFNTLMIEKYFSLSSEYQKKLLVITRIFGTAMTLGGLFLLYRFSG